MVISCHLNLADSPSMQAYNDITSAARTLSSCDDAVRTLRDCSTVIKTPAIATI